MAYNNTTEVRESRTVDTTNGVRANRVSGPVLAARVVYYIGGAIMTLLALRFLLALLGADRTNPFADFVFSLSYPFVYPFFGLFGYEPSYGQVSLELGTLVAIAVYGIVTAGLAKLFTLPRRDASAV